MPQIFLVYTLSNIYFISKLLLLIIHVKHRWVCKHSYLDFWLFFLLFYPGVQPINNVLIVSGRQQMDSVIHICVSILPQTPFPHNIEQNSCGPCCLFMFNPALCQFTNTFAQDSGTWPLFKIPTQSFSGLRRNTCSRKFCF